jgi:hypothetical protein
MLCSETVTIKPMHRSDERTLLQHMHIEGTQPLSGSEEESDVELYKNDVTGLCQSSAGVVNGQENCRPPVRRRPTRLKIRVREIECVLAEIQAQIEMLRRERSYLQLVREELVGMEVKWNRSSLRNTLLKETDARVRVEPTVFTHLKQ